MTEQLTYCSNKNNKITSNKAVILNAATVHKNFPFQWYLNKQYLQ